MMKITLDEYPRPQLVRNSYIGLDGIWNCCITKTVRDESDGSRNKPDIIYQGDINVPFVPGSIKSGVSHLLKPDETITYSRTFHISPEFLDEVTILHFDAVDYRCEAYINGQFIARNTGGYLPFSCDMTRFVQKGENRVDLVVTDPTDSELVQRGKQTLNPRGIFYTPLSGIWQQVWIESMPEGYVQSIKIDTDIDSGTVTIKAQTDSTEFFATVKMGEEIINQGLSDKDKVIVIKLEKMRLWSPEDPFLYGLEIKAGNDIVTSYFGMRKFSIVMDDDGHLRLALNNRIYFHNGVLDQGYYPDTLYTAKSEKELQKDIILVKQLGFNMLRKHVKIEPLRWYYHCDKMGILVWQDMVSGGDFYRYPIAYRNPEYHKTVDDTKQQVIMRNPVHYREQFEKEIVSVVNHLYNCTSICTWTLFNEGWGQYDSNRLTSVLRNADNTRHIDSTSGWYMQKNSNSDFYSKHIYYLKVKFSKKRKFKDYVTVLSEFGGYAFRVHGHEYDSKKSFGYTECKTKDALEKAYEALYKKQVFPHIKKGLSACVYTQLTDVETEINGLVTYDRQVVKMDKDKTKAINDVINNMNEIMKTDTNFNNPGRHVK